MTRPVKVNDFIPPFKRKRNYPAECSTGYPVVEITRLELVTYTLRTYRATNCAISPNRCAGKLPVCAYDYTTNGGKCKRFFGMDEIFMRRAPSAFLSSLTLWSIYAIISYGNE